MSARTKAPIRTLYELRADLGDKTSVEKVDDFGEMVFHLAANWPAVTWELFTGNACCSAYLTCTSERLHDLELFRLDLLEQAKRMRIKIVPN